MRADVIPQLADAAEVLARIDVPEDVAVSVLVPNERGLENALALLDETRARGARQAFDEINVFLSASETHNRKNVNRSIEESLAGLELVLGRAREAGLRCEGVISTSFGCPYEGHVPPERVLEIARRLHAAGAQEIGFGDTTGMANPRQVGEFFALWRDDLQEAQLTAHFHNTRGQGLANVLAALRGRDRQLRVELRRARRLSGAGRRDRQHRDRGSRLDAPRDGHRDGHRPGRAARLRPPRAGDPRPAAGQPHARGRASGVAARPPPPTVVAARRPSDARSRASPRRSTPAPTTSISSVCASAGRAEASITRLARPTATWEFASSSSTSACVACSSSSAATTRLTRPMRCASAASIVRGGHDQLLRAAEADDRGQPRGAADVGDDPELDLGQAELRVLGGDPQVAAERDLQRAAEAGAVDLADDRLGHLFAEVRAVEEDVAEGAQHARVPAKDISSPRSTPAEKTGPSPRSTTQCTEASSAAARSASASSSSSAWFIALRFSGRFSTTWRTAPRSSVVTRLIWWRC